MRPRYSLGISVLFVSVHMVLAAQEPFQCIFKVLAAPGSDLVGLNLPSIGTRGK